MGKIIILLTLCCSVVVNAQERISVRSGDHPTYSRVVFDWTRTVGYSATLDQSKLNITFDANATPDFNSVMMNGPAFFSNPAYQIDDGQLIVTFDTNNVSRIRHFRSGSKIVIDLLADGTPLPSDNVDANIVTASTDVPSPVLPQQTDVSEPEADTEMPVVALEELPNETNAGVRNVDGGLTILGNETRGAFVIDYHWDVDVKAAAFIRSNKLWVVFDKFIMASHAELDSILGKRVLSAEQLIDLSPTIFNYTIAPNQNARMVKTLKGWQVSLRSNVAVPQIPIEFGQQSVSNVGENIFLVINEPGEVINVIDPIIGDNLVIVPTGISSQGVLEQNNYSEFNILKTAQGIALQLIADDIFVDRFDNGVAVTGQNGLALTRNSIANIRQPSLASAEDMENSKPLMLLDFATWEEGPLPGSEFTKNRHELLYRLSRSAEKDRNEARWELATYDMANNNAAEAYGILQLMAESEPAFIDNPSYRALLGVANVKLRRFEKAIELLNHKAFVAELDAVLWRGLAYEEIGNHQKAYEDFNRGIDVLALQTDDHKADFIFSSVRAAEALGNVEFMNSQINGLSNVSLNAKKLIGLDYWRGRMAEGIGDDALAGETYDKVVAAGVRYPASLATFARVNQKFRVGEIDATQAIDALEKLRFAWRGDDFELDLLEQLGDLYVNEGEYREGLSILRQAATYFPRTARTRVLTKQMTDIYHDLFLGGGG